MFRFFCLYSSSDAFDRLKVTYKNADLDRFYISQLYEYEPILKVQLAQSCGHSCSRAMLSATLKRKKDIYDDNDWKQNHSNPCNNERITSSYEAKKIDETNPTGTDLPHYNLTSSYTSLPSPMARVKRLNMNTNNHVPHHKIPELSTTANQLLSNLNPLRQFYTAQMDEDVNAEEEMNSKDRKEADTMHQQKTLDQWRNNSDYLHNKYPVDDYVME